MAKAKTARQKLVAQVLKDVNAIRKHFGMGALKTLQSGYREDADSCPIAESLSDGTYGLDGAAVDADGIRLTLSDPIEVDADDVEVQVAGLYGTAPSAKTEVYKVTLSPTPAFERFVNLFDQGRFPEFDLNSDGPQSENDEDYEF